LVILDQLQQDQKPCQIFVDTPIFPNWKMLGVDGENLKYAAFRNGTSAQYDVICFSMLLERVQEPLPDLFQRLQGSLNKNGKVIFCVYANANAVGGPGPAASPSASGHRFGSQPLAAFGSIPGWSFRIPDLQNSYGKAIATEANLGSDASPRRSGHIVLLGEQTNGSG
jgi:hypothetical protein